MKSKTRAKQQKSNSRAGKPRRNKVPATMSIETVKTAAATSSAAEGKSTKQALLLALMRRKSGATIDEAVAALGWQPHSVRGVISGVVRKKLKLTVHTEQDDTGCKRYRIV